MLNLTERTTSSENESPFRRRDWIVAACVFLVAFALYFRTMGTDVMMGDSGEFQVLSVTGGLAHAFGYPIYLIVAKLFTLVPVGSLAARVNFDSVVFGSLTIAALYLLARSLGVRRAFSVLGVIALMVSPLFWWQCVIAEEYPMSSFVLVCILLCAVRWRQTRDSRWLMAGGLLGGLSLGLHHAILLITPAMAAFIAVCRASKKEWGSAGAGVLVGSILAFAAYYIMASIPAAPSSTNYLRANVVQFGLQSGSDLDSPVAKIEFVFMARQFHGEMQLSHFGPHVSWVTDEIEQDFGWAVPILALVGVVAFFVRRGRRREGVLIAGSFAALFLIAMLMENINLEVEFIQAYVVMCLLAAVGLQGLQDWVLRSKLPTKRLAWITGLVGAAVIVAGSWEILSGAKEAVAAGAPTFLIGDRRKYPYPVDFPHGIHYKALEIVSGAPDGSLMLINWTYKDACYYVAQFEQNKPRIDIIAALPDDRPGEAGLSSMLAFYKEQALKRPIFSDSAQPYMDAAFRQIPVLEDRPGGTVYLYRLVPRG